MDDELNQPGVLLDDRPQEEKLKDYTFEEVVAAAAPVEWKEKSEAEWRSFPIYNQNGSGSCVAQTIRKMLGIYISLKASAYLPLSASHIYQRRSNKPYSGMMGVDAFKVAQKGTTLEVFAPSEKLTDAQMDSAKINLFEENIGYSFKIGQYLEIKDRTIDNIASIIQETGKGVMVWFYFSSGLTPKEWVDVPEVKHQSLPLSGPNTARHSVTAVDFTLYKGKKALIIEDSWGLTAAMNGRRIITEDFFKARNFFAAHFMNFAFENESQDPVVPKPHYIFVKDLEFSPVFTQDPDVKALQDILKYEGLFPSNVESSGYFGAITKEKVGEFQLKHAIVSAPSDTGYGRVGPKTRATLNDIYGT